MMSRSKQKGTSAETALVRFLQGQGFPYAERRALASANDLGDVVGTIGLCWEVKNHKSYKIPAWLDETKVETENSKSDFGILVVKPNGIGLGSVGKWWAIMDVESMTRLLRDAGYGSPNEA